MRILSKHGRILSDGILHALILLALIAIQKTSIIATSRRILYCRFITRFKVFRLYRNIFLGSYYSVNVFYIFPFYKG